MTAHAQARCLNNMFVQCSTTHMQLATVQSHAAFWPEHGASPVRCFLLIPTCARDLQGPAASADERPHLQDGRLGGGL